MYVYRIISPGRGENKKHLKPPPSALLDPGATASITLKGDTVHQTLNGTLPTDPVQ